MGGFQYVAGKLSFFPHAEGYINVTVGRKGAITYNYVYQYKDHLGNNRLSYAIAEDQFFGQPTQFTILEENHYYPFGLKHSNYNTNQYQFVEVENGTDYYINITQVPAGGVSNYKYKYLGQELQDELGLNWYSYKWRNADPALGRFFGIDPISEDYYYQTNYQFASNNPVWKIEIEGLEGQMTNDGTDLQDDKTFLDGWNSTVRNFNSNFYSGVNDFFQKPIETTDNFVANTIIGTAQFIGDVTGFNTLLGLENRTVDAIASFIQNAPNMNAEQAGAAAAIIFIEGAEVVILHKMPLKNVPNPNGKKGGSAHQQKVSQSIDNLKDEGFDVIETEVMVKTPGGNKGKRFIDVRGTNSKTGATKDIQVGRKNKRGDAVARERRALDDIENATGSRPEFVPYN
jgi:RHS repeat-associated protein